MRLNSYQLQILECVDSFDPQEFKGKTLDSNIEYLEKTLERLEGLRTKAAIDMRTAKTARIRGVARDTMNQVDGLIAGIKFGISYCIYSEENLNEDHAGQG